MRTALAEGKPVRTVVGDRGLLHIDRPLPFIVTYLHRRPKQDVAIERLVSTQASFLYARADAAASGQAVELVASEALERFGCFLVIDLCEAPGETSGGDGHPHLLEPAFYIEASLEGELREVMENLEAELGAVEIHGRRGCVRQGIPVEQESDSEAADRGGETGGNGAKDESGGDCDEEVGELPRGAHQILLGIAPIYRNQATGGLYPQVLLELQQKLAPVLCSAIFNFVRTHSRMRPVSRYEFGRRAMVDAVYEIDRRLGEVEKSFDFLLHVSPVNGIRAWEEFRKRRYKRCPAFWYRPVPFDPEVIKRALYDLPIEKVEDPTLALLLREKQEELDRKVTMLRDRGTRHFLYGSLQVYGGVDPPLLELAKDILREISPGRDDEEPYAIDAEEMMRRAREEIRAYRGDVFQAEVQIRSDLTSLMVSKRALLIPERISLSERRAEALLHHEVGTHLLTWINGEAQPLELLRDGLAGYEDFQEGIAVVSEFLSGGLDRNRLRILAARVVTVHALLQGARFAEVYARLVEEYSLEPYEAFLVVMRVWRGGGFTKDAIYLRGLVQVLGLLKTGAEFASLFVGKIALAHVPVMEELRLRGILKPQPLMPRVLDLPGADRRLRALRHGMAPVELCSDEILSGSESACA